MVREMSLMCSSFPLPVSLLGLRYLEAFFGMLIAVMCGMFGWMVRGRGKREEGEREMREKREDGRGRYKIVPLHSSMYILNLIKLKY